jgi:hypothetical protein
VGKWPRALTERRKARLLGLFAGDLPLIGEIIGATGSDIGAHVVEDLATTPVWHRGPAVLIGDAAHAWIYTYHVDWDEHAQEPLRPPVPDPT